MTATLRRGSETLDSRRLQFGIRTVTIEEIPDRVGAGPAAGSSFTLVVNGARVFARGGNWVPPSPFPGMVAPAQYERLIDMARRGNMNLLRAWGGGIYEPAAFWDACDRMGIMISQDFQLACADYPEDDPEFMALLRTEFETAIRMLRSRASLIFWCGNNELGMNSDPATPFSGKKISLEISEPLCRRLDPTRPYRMTSPYGGNPNNSPLAGDCHNSAWYRPDFYRTDMTDYRRRIDRLDGRFLSESAMPGAPPRHVLLKFMSEADLADPAGRIWEFHTKDNPYNGINDLTHYRMLDKTGRALFGPPADNDRRISQLEYTQYEYVRLTTEHARRRKFYCSGIQYWMFNDNWPASGWSMIDWSGFAKAGWHAARRAYQPVIASIEDAEGRLRVWACNDRLRPLSGTLRLRIQPWSGPPRWEARVPVTVAANAATVVYELPRPEFGRLLRRDAVLVADLETTTVANLAEADIDTDRAWFFDGMPREMDLAPARLRVSGPTEGSEGELRVATDNYARVVTLASDLDFSDNYFDLLPGEEWTIQWSSPNGAHAGPIPVTCWNGAIERN